MPLSPLRYVKVTGALSVMQSFLRLVDKRHVTKYTLFHDQILR